MLRTGGRRFRIHFAQTYSATVVPPTPTGQSTTDCYRTTSVQRASVPARKHRTAGRHEHAQRHAHHRRRRLRAAGVATAFSFQRSQHQTIATDDGDGSDHGDDHSRNASQTGADQALSNIRRVAGDDGELAGEAKLGGIDDIDNVDKVFDEFGERCPESVHQSERIGNRSAR